MKYMIIFFLLQNSLPSAKLSKEKQTQKLNQINKNKERC